MEKFQQAAAVPIHDAAQGLGAFGEVSATMKQYVVRSKLTNRA